MPSRRGRCGGCGDGLDRPGPAASRRPLSRPDGWNDALSLPRPPACLSRYGPRVGPDPPEHADGTKPAAADPAPKDLAALIATLENEQARAELLARLKALAEAQPPAPPQKDLVTEVVEGLNSEVTERVDIMGTAFAEIRSSLREVPVLMSWLHTQLLDPGSQRVWRSVLENIWIALLGGLAAAVGVRIVLRKWRRQARAALPQPAPWTRKLAASLGSLTIDLLALTAFIGVTTLMLRYFEVTYLARAVARDILGAILIGRGIGAVIKAVLATDNPSRRLIPLSDERALSIRRWMFWILNLSVYGYFGLLAARRVGLPWPVHGFLLHLLFLVVVGLIVIYVFRVRRDVAAVIEQWGSTSTNPVTRYLPWQLMAATGHYVIAGFFILDYLVWAVKVPGGAVRLAIGFVATLGAIVFLRAYHVWLERRFLSPPPAEGADPAAAPDVDTVSRRAAVLAARLLTMLVALVVVLQAWGLDVIAWAETETGGAVLQTVLRMATIVGALALLALIVNQVARKYMSAADEEGNLVYSNRVRTLASIARNFGLTVLIFMAVMTVLSQIGVDATALFAGAGVVGLAIGFGSQRLVQDLITGLFILLGDTIRVGDVVDLGGHSGAVEAMSMRTVTLRAYNGSVFTVPYSSIDVVTNLTKDFSYCVFDISVAYREDVDKVMDVLREIDTELRREWPYRRLILEPIEMAGLDRFVPSAVQVMARSKTRPGEQWRVQREFNRRLKARFEELGIEIPFPQQTLSFAPDRGDKAPPPSAIERARRELLEAGRHEDDGAPATAERRVAGQA